MIHRRLLLALGFGPLMLLSVLVVGLTLLGVIGIPAWILTGNYWAVGRWMFGAENGPPKGWVDHFIQWGTSRPETTTQAIARMEKEMGMGEPKPTHSDAALGVTRSSHDWQRCPCAACSGMRHRFTSRGGVITKGPK